MQLGCVCQAGENENKLGINFTFVCPFTLSDSDAEISQNNYRKVKYTECQECVLSNTTASTVGERGSGLIIVRAGALSSGQMSNDEMQAKLPHAVCLWVLVII